MTVTTIEQEIIEAFRTLGDENRRRFLEYLRSLARPQGISGKEFLQRTKDIRISPEDLQAIDEEFGKVDPA
jgi:DNA-binding transcriptional ArsR family regulator